MGKYKIGHLIVLTDSVSMRRTPHQHIDHRLERISGLSTDSGFRMVNKRKRRSRKNQETCGYHLQLFFFINQPLGIIVIVNIEIIQKYFGFVGTEPHSVGWILWRRVTWVDALRNINTGNVMVSSSASINWHNLPSIFDDFIQMYSPRWTQFLQRTELITGDGLINGNIKTVS